MAKAFSYATITLRVGRHARSSRRSRPPQASMGQLEADSHRALLHGIVTKIGGTNVHVWYIEPCIFKQPLKTKGLLMGLLRKRKGWTQIDMAVALDMNRGHISDIEQRKREAGIVKLQVIARGLGTTMSELLRRL